MDSRSRSWLFPAAAVAAAVVLLQGIRIDYTAHYFGLQWGPGQASLLHLHIGLLLMVALLGGDRRVLAAGFAAMLLGWYGHVAWSGDWDVPQALLMPPYLGLMWWWTDRCARWIGAPFGIGHPFEVRHVPRLLGYGLLLYPLGWVAVIAAMRFVLLDDPLPVMANEAVQQFLAKHVGIGCVALPLLLFWTDPRLVRRPWLRIAGACGWLGCAVLLSLLLGRWLQTGDDAGLRALFDYRLSIGALLAVAMLTLRPAWSMPLLSLSQLTMLHALASTAQRTRDFGQIGLLFLHALELNFIALMLALLFLVQRERRQALRHMREVGRQDATTGLPNANALRQEWLALAQPPATVGFIVLDHVEKLLGSYGWRAQTAMLRDVARQLSPITRPFHLGGGQFVLLPGEIAMQETIRQPWHEVLRKLQAHVFSWRGAELRIAPYLGLASPARDALLDECVADACEAAMQARRRGESEPVFTMDDDDAETRSVRRARLGIASEALSQIRAGRIELHAQPILRIDGMPVAPGFRGEVLCRLRARDGELMMPAEFVGDLEDHGHVAELDLAVVEALFAWLSAHPEALPRIRRLGINLSGLSLASDSFRGRMVELLQDAPIEHGALCFELTETAVISRFSPALRLFENLRALGCGMALDDFGSGMQSFERLKQMPLDIVKIDGQFVRHVADGGSDREIVRAAIAVARAYDLATVAEYVENETILDTLRGLGVQWGQGFHLGRPRPLAECVAMVG